MDQVDGSGGLARRGGRRCPGHLRTDEFAIKDAHVSGDPKSDRLARADATRKGYRPNV
jgi:hypothetical protein